MFSLGPVIRTKLFTWWLLALEFSLFSMCMTCSLQSYSSSCCCFLRELVSFVHLGDYLNFDMWHILHQWEKIWVGNIEHVTITQVQVYMYVVKHSTLPLLHSMKHFYLMPLKAITSVKHKCLVYMKEKAAESGICIK